ncbi:hypothetical protein GW17_00019864 [Ensete ventricosum]|nr:hypothetical protein GW17_00019864 [Ensete ventricosum]
MVCTIPASAWTWLVRPRKASVVTISGAGFDAGEGNLGSVIILQKRLGVGTAAVASSVGRGWSGSVRCSVPESPNGCSGDMGPPSSAKNVRGESGACLVDTFRLCDYGASTAGSGPCALARPRSSRSFYSEYCRSFIHSNLTAFMVDHVVVPFHHTRRPCVKYLGRCKHCTSVSVPSAPPPSTSDSGGREGAPHGMASAVGVPAMRIRLAAQRQRKHENTAPHHLAPISFIPAVVGSCEMMGSQ